MPAANLRALIFDMDGTLADTERDGHRLAFNAAFRDFGLDWEWDVATYCELLAVGGGKERIAHYIARQRPDFRQPDLPELVDRLHQAKTRHFEEILRRGRIPLRPGVARLIGEARAARLLLGIATTAAMAGVLTLLHASLGPESQSWFAAIGAGDVVPRKKPAPDIYLWVLEKLGVAPNEAIAIEDSAPGLAAARGAGLTTLITVSDYTRTQDFTGAVAVLSDLGEPDRPFRVLRGDDAGSAWADLAALASWHGRIGGCYRGQSKL